MDEILGSSYREKMNNKKIVLTFLTGLFLITSTIEARGISSGRIAPAGKSVTSETQQGSLERIAMRLFRAAIEKYEDKAYWHATRELIILLDFYPNFSKTDGVLYYLGACLYQMDMYKSSSKMLRYLITNYPQSEYLPETLLSLQKLHYSTNELDNSLNYFVGITTRFPNDDVLDGSYYYGGMAFFHQKNYDEAIRAFGRVRSRSEFYDYGLYTVGLSFLKKKIFNNPLESSEN
jgi:TolA-binding protein